MKKIYFIFPIYFLACTLHSSAQINITDDLKQQLAAINNATVKSRSDESASINSDYFKQRISLFTNNSFKLSLVANANDATDNGTSTQSTDQKETVKNTVESKKLNRDAKYFRQHISLFNGHSFQFNLVANKPEKTLKPVTVVTETESAVTVIPTEPIKVALESKKTKRDAQFFRQHINLFNGDHFQLNLARNQPENIADQSTNATPVESEKAVTETKAFTRDAKYFRQHISLINGNAFQLSLESNKVTKKVKAKKQFSIADRYAYTTGIFEKQPIVTDNYQPFPSVTDLELQSALVQNIDMNMAALKNQFAMVVADTLRAGIPQKMPANVTNLKQQVALVFNDTLRATLYQTIAAHYMVYDSISILQTKNFFQDAALEFTMKALHTYSKYGDQEGLRNSYSNLARVYKDQSKFSEAKWFVLQANFIARQQKDTRHIVSTLIDLAAVKTAIKDYKLALGDLDEALLLSTQNHYAKQESSVQANYAVVYAQLNNTAKSAAALKRHNAIENAIRKADEAKNAPVIVKMTDSTSTSAPIPSKKKLAVVLDKKAAKTAPAKKAVVL